MGTPGQGARYQQGLLPAPWSYTAASPPDPPTQRPGPPWQIDSTEWGAGSALCAHKDEETKPREVRQPATVTQQSWLQAWAGKVRPLSTARAGRGSCLKQLHLRSSRWQLTTLVMSEVKRHPERLPTCFWSSGVVVGWGAPAWGGGNWCGAVTRLELTGPSHTLRPRLRCVCGACLGPPGKRGWKASLLPGLGVSWSLCSGPGPLQEGQLHQTHAWLERGVWPSLSAELSHLPWDLAVSAPTWNGSDPGAVLASRRQWPERQGGGGNPLLGTHQVCASPRPHIGDRGSGSSQRPPEPGRTGCA